MSIDQPKLSAATRFLLCWRKIKAGYAYANVLSHHVIGAALKTVIVLYFLFCAIFLILRYAILPHIDYFKPNIEQEISHIIGQPVSITALHASWDGLWPRLALDNVVVRDQFGHDALILPKVSAAISWLTVFGMPRLHYLEIDHPDLDIRRDSNGKLYVAGMLIATEGKNDGEGLNWLLSQKEIIIRDGRVRWDDQQRQAPELSLENVNIVLRNHWQHHEFALHAKPPASLATPIDFRAAFDHPFAHNRSDVSRWKGELYFDLGNTDLAAWKTYLPYPLEVQQGHGSIRAWLDFDHVKVANFTADLTLANTAVRLQSSLPMLSLDQLHGRISMQEEIDAQSDSGTPTFGANGHSISLTDFSMRTSDGLVLPPTTISETYQPAQNSQESKTSFSVAVLDLQTLANIAERLPLSAPQRQMLIDFAPTGKIFDVSSQWQGDYPKLSAYDVKGNFVGLSLKAQAARPAQPRIGKQPAQAAVPFIPGFTNVTGKVAMDDKGGSVDIASDKLQIGLPGVFDDAMVLFDKLDAQMDWRFQDKDKVLLQINTMQFVQNGMTGSLNGTQLVSLNQTHGKSPGIADFTGHIVSFDVKKLDHYLPLKGDPKFRSWITGALVSGSARDIDIKIKGDLKDFPFHPETPNEKPKGIFTVRGKIVDGVLNYAPNVYAKDGKSPFWPLLEDIQGTIAFDRTRMEIYAERAKTHGVAMSAVKAILPDVTPPKNNILDIDGTAVGTFEDFIGYTKDSPVQDMIAGFTNNTRGSGNARLALKLQLPLSDLNHSKVQGKVQFSNNDIDLLPGLPQLVATTGTLEFSEKGFNLNGIHTTFLGGGVLLSGGGAPEATIIKADGTLTADGLRKFAPPAAQQLAHRVTGSARYNVAINVKKNHSDIVVDSNLQGLGVDLPVPLHKEPNETLPTRFEMVGTSPPDAAIAKEEIKLSLGSVINTRYQREKSAERDAPWHMVAGAIGVNTPAVPPASGLLLSVNLKSLDVDGWLDLANALAPPDAAKQNGTASVDTLGMSEFISPNAFAARATEMIVFKHKLDNVALTASLHRDLWQAKITSGQVSGDISYAVNADQGKGRVTARLASLIIPEETASKVVESQTGKNTASDLPALDIEADNFDFLGKHFGKLVLDASNVRTTNSNEWQIKKLSVVNPDGTLNVTNGSWISKGTESHSSLTYTLDVNDAGHLLERLGFPGVLSGGKGSMDGKIDWNGVPYSLDFPSLSGNVNLRMSKGQFIKEGPGPAKLLGVLSLQSLPRRLSLDFRDVFSDGLAFDDITMTAAISNGVFSTDTLKMAGLDVTVLLSGSVNLVEESSNLRVVVIPHLDASAASVVYGLVVNPVIGVGTFLAQLFLRAPLTKALTHEYQITGLWTDPVYTKIEQKIENPRKADSGNTVESKN